MIAPTKTFDDRIRDECGWLSVAIGITESNAERIIRRTITIGLSTGKISGGKAEKVAKAVEMICQEQCVKVRKIATDKAARNRLHANERLPKKLNRRLFWERCSH